MLVIEANSETIPQHQGIFNEAQSTSKNFLATEVTENSEKRENEKGIFLNYFPAVLCALCVLRGKKNCCFEFDRRAVNRVRRSRLWLLQVKLL
jgi:hypothetical protein